MLTDIRRLTLKKFILKVVVKVPLSSWVALLPLLSLWLVVYLSLMWFVGASCLRLYQTHLTADLQLAHLWLITQVSPRVLKAVEILQSCQFVARSLVMYHQATICPLCTFLWLKLLSLLLQHILFCGLNFGSSLKICLPSRWNIPSYKFSCVFFEL